MTKFDLDQNMFPAEGIKLEQLIEKGFEKSDLADDFALKRSEDGEIIGVYRRYGSKQLYFPTTYLSYLKELERRATDAVGG